MDVDRRSLLAISLATGTLADPRATPVGSIAPATSMTSITALGVNAVYLGVQPGSPDDQTQVLQRAIERASGAGVPLVLPPGVYRAGRLELPTGTHLIGMPGATRLILAQDGPLASTNDADYLTISGPIARNHCGTAIPALAVADRSAPGKQRQYCEAG